MNKVYLSKSRYCQCVQCEKIFWLNKYKPDEQAGEDKTVLFVRRYITMKSLILAQDER